MQAPITGQLSSQVPNQAGSQLHGLSQPNGNTFPPQIPSGAPRSTINMDPEFLRARSFMQQKM